MPEDPELKKYASNQNLQESKRKSKSTNRTASTKKSKRLDEELDSDEEDTKKNNE